ncbi:SCO3933 family regulatory protein [Streptomyces sp. NPDC055107]
MSTFAPRRRNRHLTSPRPVRGRRTPVARRNRRTDPPPHATGLPGRSCMTVDVMFAANEVVKILSVTVPEPGISGELMMGTPVAVTGLIARPWENEFNGQKRHGIAFRAVAVTSLVAAAEKPKAA